jgi:hypothetical protein
MTTAADIGRPVGSVEDFAGGRWTMAEVEGREVGIDIRDRVAGDNARELFGERLAGTWKEVAA